MAALDRRRRKLLELHYAYRISAQLFAEEERRIAEQIEAIRNEGERLTAKEEELDEIAAPFEQLASFLRDLDLDRIWAEATDQERRRLVEEMVEGVVVFPDHLVVAIFGAPKLNIALEEVGLGKQSENVGVGGGI